MQNKPPLNETRPINDNVMKKALGEANQNASTGEQKYAKEILKEESKAFEPKDKIPRTPYIDRAW